VGDEGNPDKKKGERPYSSLRGISEKKGGTLLSGPWRNKVNEEVGSHPDGTTLSKQKEKREDSYTLCAHRIERALWRDGRVTRAQAREREHR